MSDERETGTMGETGRTAVVGLDGLLGNRGDDLPVQPSWALIAELLVGASGYE